MLAAAVVLAMMASLFLLAVYLTWVTGQWKGMLWFWNSDAKFSWAEFLLGLIPGAVFGFVDQMSLWTSVWSDQPMTFSNMLSAVMGPALPRGELTRQGWGNLMSDTVGTFCAVMVAKIVAVSSGRSNAPLYSEILGVIIGCLLGIYLPRLVTGRA